MLALERSLGVVAGLALFGDHADPARVYYVPTRPRLARIGSAPELSFVRLQRADAEQGAVGFLSFTSELSASQLALSAAREHLVRLGTVEPLLVPVPYTSGSAVLAAALQEGDGFVEKLIGEVPPDLCSDNRALFALRLSGDGAALIEGLIANEGPSPLGVRYELEYLGLRPALQVHVHADYRRIYQELSWGFQIGVAYEGIGVRAAVESSTQKLIQSGAIELEVLQFDDDAALRARIDEAVRWLNERILRDFFQSSLKPPARDDLLQRALDAARRLGAATLQDALKDSSLLARLASELGIPTDAVKKLAEGAAARPDASNSSTFALQLQFSFRDIHQEELRTLSFDWREAAAEKRTAAPQGLLTDLAGAPQVTEPADGKFFERLDVNVRPLGDFAALGVQRMLVQLAYPDEVTPDKQALLAFDPGDATPQRFSTWTNGKGPRYRVRTEVNFDERGPWPGPPTFAGEWQTHQSLELSLHPLNEVPRLELEIAPGTLLFSETPQVQIDLRSAGEGLRSFTITAAQPRTTFRCRLDRATLAAGLALPLIEFRYTWFLLGGGRVSGDWAPLEQSALFVPRPWRSTRKLRLVSLLPADFLQALVNVSLLEGASSAPFEVRFEPGGPRMQTVDLPSLSELPAAARIDTLVVRADGSVFTCTLPETRDAVVLVRDREGDFRQVSVRLLAGPTLSGHGLMALQVQLIDADDHTLDSVVFTESARNPGLLLVPNDAGAPPARYRVIRYALDGSATRGAPETIEGSEIRVPALASS